MSSLTRKRLRGLIGRLHAPFERTFVPLIGEPPERLRSRVWNAARDLDVKVEIKVRHYALDSDGVWYPAPSSDPQAQIGFEIVYMGLRARPHPVRSV